MKESLIFYHSNLKYVVLFVIVAVAIFAYINWKKQKPYTNLHNILTRLNIGLNHAQMLLGVILMTHSPNVSYNSASLSNKLTLFWSIIHPTIMFAAIVFVTLSLMLVRNKKNDIQKHRITFIMNLLALIAVLIGLALIP